ncbi:MAG: hypothetical protein V4649_01380 [Bacteroidota bacterium]
MGRILCIVLLLVAAKATGQQYVYVNTDNLIMRDLPRKDYIVHDVLHAPARLKVLPYQPGEPWDTGKFYYVRVTYVNDDGIESRILGWVMKRYVVRQLADVTWPGADTTQLVNHEVVPLVPYATGDWCDPDRNNRFKYPYPKYKGGERVLGQAVKPKRYYTGPMGGCYYMNGKGHRIYVDKKHCAHK